MPNFYALFSFCHSLYIVLYNEIMNLTIFCLDCLLTIRKMLKPYTDKLLTLRIKVYVLLGYLNFLKYPVIGILNMLDTNDYCQYH